MIVTREYYLMHKDIPVCLFSLTPNNEIHRIRRILSNQNHFPLGGIMNESKFHEWWNDRAIPKTRHGAASALEKLGYKSTSNVLIDNLALSLTDCYWIKPINSDITWNKVNLFKNDFLDIFGELTLNESLNINDIRNRTKFSPASSQGELQKKWCIDKNKKRFLVKGNYGQSYQQSLNEVFVSSVHKSLGCDFYTPYYVTKITTKDYQDSIGCLSYNFCNEKVESISAYELIQTDKIKPGSYYFLLRNACIKYGMKEKTFNDFIDYMIMTDFLFTNTDRHMNNIAILRNPDALELIGFAPLYDTGNSMFYNYNLDQLKKVKLNTIKTHCFVERELDLLKYVKNRKCINLNKINPDFSIYQKDTSEQKERYPLIKELFNQKLSMLKEFQNGIDIWKKYPKK